MNRFLVLPVVWLGVTSTARAAPVFLPESRPPPASTEANAALDAILAGTLPERVDDVWTDVVQAFVKRYESTPSEREALTLALLGVETRTPKGRNLAESVAVFLRVRQLPASPAVLTAFQQAISRCTVVNFAMRVFIKHNARAAITSSLADAIRCTIEDDGESGFTETTIVNILRNGAEQAGIGPFEPLDASVLDAALDEVPKPDTWPANLFWLEFDAVGSGRFRDELFALGPRFLRGTCATVSLGPLFRYAASSEVSVLAQKASDIGLSDACVQRLVEQRARPLFSVARPVQPEP